MYLQYQQTSPKKTFLKRKKTAIIQPEQFQKQKEAAVKFLQRKVQSSLESRKLWRQVTPPTPPPKKSQTVPNLTIITDRDILMSRALPRLPSCESIEKKPNGITRATTWVGKSIQKWLSQEEKTVVVLEDKVLPRQPEPIVLPTTQISNKKMTLHCRILQVTNLTSAKNYQYSMLIYVTNNPTQTHMGTMKKVAKGLSAAHPRAALSFHVEGRFQLECDLSIKACQPNSIVNRLKRLRSRSDLSEEESEIRGKLYLDSGDDALSSFANKGIGRYAIQTSTSVTLELTIAFWLEDEMEEQKLNTPIDHDILTYCQTGDYLTFYMKGEIYPTWNRYWVTFDNNSLVLRMNERGSGEPFDTIPLDNITHVETNPSDDIKEQVYLGKKYTIVLSLKDSNLYLFCDTFKSMRFWKCLFEQHMTICSGSQKTGKDIHMKYLWPLVAQ